METDFSKPLSEAELQILHGRNPDRARESESNLGGQFDEGAAAVAEAAADEVLSSRESNESITEDANDGGQLQGQADGQQDGQQGGTKEAEAAQADSWITENVLGYGKTYGFTIDDLREFGSQEELERIGAKLDKYMGRIMRPADQQQQANSSQQQSPSATVQQSAAQAPSTATAAAPIPDKPGFKEGKIDLEYFKSNYEADDPIFAIVEHAMAQESARGKIDEEIEQLKQNNAAVVDYMARQEQAAQTNALHSAMDSYNADLYGKAFDENGNPVKLADDVMKRRTEIYETIQNTIWPRIERQHQLGTLERMPTYPELVHQAARVVHAKELDQIASKKKADALVAQNKKIRQVANASNGYRPRVPAKGPLSDFDKLNTNPQLLEQWEQLEKEGVV